MSGDLKYKEMFFNLIVEYDLKYNIPTVSHPDLGGINFSYMDSPKRDYERLKEWCGGIPKDDNDDINLRLVIQKSDNSYLYQNLFVKAAKILIDGGQFKLDDFKYSNGWSQSITEDDCYYIYPRDYAHATFEKKYYLNIKTKKLYNITERTEYKL